MYVVTAGLLDVEVQGETVRQVGAGAVLGELALLTGGRRSASIRARRDSHLLRVTHETFEEVVGTDAARAPCAHRGAGHAAAGGVAAGVHHHPAADPGRGRGAAPRGACG